MISNIIPSPKRVELLCESVESPLAASTERRWSVYVGRLASALERFLDQLIGIGERIRISYDETCSPHAYRIEIDDSTVLFASDEEGCFYAIASLLSANTAA